jgi:hypothetical protein
VLRAKLQKSLADKIQTEVGEFSYRLSTTQRRSWKVSRSRKASVLAGAASNTLLLSRDAGSLFF